MQLALSTPTTQPPVPAMGQLSEKPRLGFTRKNAAWNPGPNVPNSTVLLGFGAGLHLNRVRSRYRGEQYDPDLGLYYLRARYYNPATGRFMSRDPEDPQIMDSDRIPVDPKALHKYLYADGDPINGIDPSGRAVLLEFSLGRRVFQVAYHGAHHFWEVALVGKLWCVHLQFLTYVAGLSGSGAKFQIPLPWCSAAGPF